MRVVAGAFAVIFAGHSGEPTTVDNRPSPSPSASVARRSIEASRRAWIVFKDGGQVVAVGEWEIKPPLVIFHGDNQTFFSAQLKSIDFDATRRLNGVPPPLPGAALELQMEEFKLTRGEELAIRREAQENVAIEMSLTPGERAERQRRSEALFRSLNKLGEELSCIARARSSLESEICRLRVEIAYR
jgi:hypothetical protein